MSVFRDAVLAQIRAELVRRKARAEKLRAAMTDAFEGTGDPAFCVRRLEVVEHVARALGIRVLTNALFVEATREAKALGWDPVKNGQRRLFRGVKRRDVDREEALAVSKGCRFDPRRGRQAAPPRLRLVGIAG